MYKRLPLKLVLPWTLPDGDVGEILLVGGENGLLGSVLFGAGVTATLPLPKDETPRLLLKIAAAPLLAEGLDHPPLLPAIKPVCPAFHLFAGSIRPIRPVAESRKWLVTNSSRP